MLKTLLFSTCLALVFFLVPAGPVYTFGAGDVAHARQDPEHKGSWIGFDFGDDEVYGGADDEGDDSGEDDERDDDSGGDEED